MANNITQLKKLRKLQPSTDWKQQQWDDFVTQISDTTEHSSATWNIASSLFHHFAAARYVVNVAMVIFIFVFSSWATLAAQETTRGDVLYPLKASVEKLSLAVTFDESSKAQKQTEFAGKRVQEIKTLAVRSSVKNIQDNKISETVQDLQTNVKQAQNSLKQVQSNNSQNRVAVARLLDETTAELGQDLIKATEKLPAAVRLSLSADIEAAEAAIEDTRHQALTVIITEGLADNQVSEEDIILRLDNQIQAVVDAIDVLSIDEWDESIEFLVAEMIEETNDDVAAAFIDPRDSVAEKRMYVEDALLVIQEQVVQKDYVGALGGIQSLQQEVGVIEKLMQQGIVKGEAEEVVADEEVLDGVADEDASSSEQLKDGRHDVLDFDTVTEQENGGETTVEFIEPLSPSTDEIIKN